MENKTIKEMTIPVSRILKLAEMLKDLEPNERIGFTYIISFGKYYRFYYIRKVFFSQMHGKIFKIL